MNEQDLKNLIVMALAISGKRFDKSWRHANDAGDGSAKDLFNQIFTTYSLNLESDDLERVIMGQLVLIEPKGGK